MEDIKQLFDKAVGEIERMLNTKTVVGEPITIEDNTLIPLVSIGFGFGVGGGQGDEPKKGTGHGGATGGGGGVKPIALVIINKDGVRVEPVTTGVASAMEKVAESLSKAVADKVVD